MMQRNWRTRAQNTRVQNTQCQQAHGPRLHYRLLTLCPWASSSPQGLYRYTAYMQPTNSVALTAITLFMFASNHPFFCLLEIKPTNHTELNYHRRQRHAGEGTLSERLSLNYFLGARRAFYIWIDMAAAQSSQERGH